MTHPIAEHYRLAAERVAEGKWTINPERGIVLGVRGRPFIRRNSWGYVQIKFRHPDDWTQEVAVLAHRVIWESIHGPVPEGKEINHRNGDKLDNRIKNLEAISHRANVHHARDTGLAVALRGEQHACSKLTEEQAKEIYRRAWAGEAMQRIARDYPIGRSMVGNIKCGLAWSHATGHGLAAA